MGESVPLVEFEEDAFLRSAVGVTLLATGFVFGIEFHSAIAGPDPVNYSILVAMVGSSTAVLASYVHQRDDGE